MQDTKVIEFAKALAAGQIGIDDFLRFVREHAFTAALDHTSVDVDRFRRCGFPEVVYCPGKTPETVARVMGTLVARGQPALATRVAPHHAEVLRAQFPDGIHNVIANTFRVHNIRASANTGIVAVVTAGTGDRPVAEEARETLAWMGVAHRSVDDVGVAGPHRLAERLGELQGCAAVIVVAGMEGALPSVVGGYVDCPVIGVPTSIGYGANLGGLSALLSMLNSCAANVAVVNIDAGFKAGYLAGMIALGRHRDRGV